MQNMPSFRSTIQQLCHLSSRSPAASSSCLFGPVRTVATKSSTQGAANAHSKNNNNSRRAEPEWKLHRHAMKKKYPQGFNPPQRLSREAMDIVRRMHASDPQTFSTPELARRFKVSAEGIRRILKSKWRPGKEQLEREQRRDQYPFTSAAAEEAAGAERVKAPTQEDEDAEVQHLVEQWRQQQSEKQQQQAHQGAS